MKGSLGHGCGLSSVVIGRSLFSCVAKNRTSISSLQSQTIRRMNCSSYIDNVIHAPSTKEAISDLNDQLTNDLQGIDAILTSLQEEFQAFAKDSTLIHQEYEKIAHQSNEIEALKAAKAISDKEVYTAVKQFVA